MATCVKYMGCFFFKKAIFGRGSVPYKSFKRAYLSYHKNLRIQRLFFISSFTQPIMKKGIPPFFLILLFILTGCEPDSSTPNPDPNPDPGTQVETIIPTGNEKYLNTKSDYIFDPSKLHTFELTIPPANLAKIDADPAAEQYVEGSLSFEGESISPVGIRYKGSIGGFVGCVSGSDWNNPSGHKTCPKLSMKVKINWEGSDTKFYKLKKLQLHSMNLDPTQMRDRLGYHLFREMGVPAPRAVHARLMINGKFAGLFILVEEVDGRFTRYHFEEGEGNLYKEIWPVDHRGNPFSEQNYLKALQTNEDENPSAALIRTFGQEIQQAHPDSMQALIRKWMDIDEIIAYAVVDRAIRNDDGAFHWYCNFFGCSSHNYYWYEEPQAARLHLIPWDLDNAFENIRHNVNPVTPIADAWGETRNDCKRFTYGSFNFQQRSAACDKLTAGWASFTDKYAELKDQLIQGPMAKAEVEALLDNWTEQIRAATTEAAQAYSDALSLAEWEGALQELKLSLDFAREN